MSETIRNITQQKQPDGSYVVIATGPDIAVPSTAITPIPPTPTPVYGMNPKRIVVAPGGSDNAAGTDSAPFASIDKAMSVWSSAMDRWIYIRGGVFARTQHYGNVTSTPTALLPLIIRNWPGEIPSFNPGPNVAGNWMVDASNNTNEKRFAYVWIHGINVGPINDATGNGRIVEIAGAPGPWRITGNGVQSTGTDYHDHALYVGKNANTTGLPCLLAGNSVAMGKGEGWGFHLYPGDGVSAPTASGLEVAYNTVTGGSGLITASSMIGGRIHHNKASGATRGTGIILGYYAAVPTKGVEVDHNIITQAQAYDLAQGSTANEHDNAFNRTAPADYGPVGAPRTVTAGPDMVDGAFTW